MLKIHRLIWGAALIAALTGTLAAQQAPTSFQRIACVKVKHGQSANFTKLLNGDGSRLEQALVNSGATAGWLVLRTEIPAGRDADCDYVFVTFYKGLPPAPLSENEFAAALKSAGIAASPEEFLAERDAAGYLVHNSIMETVAQVGRAKKGDYLVVNSMSAPDRVEAIAYENRMWKPLAESLVKSGAEDGWVMNEQVFPSGVKDAGLSTVDIFPSWDAWVHSRQQYGEQWKTVHPNTDIVGAIDRFGKLDPIEHTVLYKVVATTQSK